MMEIGQYTYGYNNIRICYTHPGEKLTVGKFCSIGKNLQIYLGGNHNMNWVTTFPFGHILQQEFDNFNGDGHPSSKGSIEIRNDVWIGDNVTIMSGVTIGDGCVIANNSHVIKNAKPYSLIGGNPAKFIKFRFTEKQIESLLHIKWWDLDKDIINTISPLLCSDNIDNCISTCLRLVSTTS